MAIRRQLLAIFLLGTLLAAPAAIADDTARACVSAARQEVRECRATCQDGFQAALDLCRKVDPQCGSACRAQRDACAAGPRRDRERAIRACNDLERTQVASCRMQFPNDVAQRDRCIDAAQIAAFVCRDNAREAVNDELRVCREGYRTCIDGCPTAP
ncbi:MAG: hypothetical protein MUC67_10755 [Acidobacteria bacterium]|nr:hypothetical protein [Acidobacteriota bacterium]